jgi:hypothetical protein
VTVAQLAREHRMGPELELVKRNGQQEAHGRVGNRLEGDMVKALQEVLPVELREHSEEDTAVGHMMGVESVEVEEGIRRVAVAVGDTGPVEEHAGLAEEHADRVDSLDTVVGHTAMQR